MPALRLYSLCLALIFTLSLSGCFGGIKRTGKVTGYKKGRVLTKKDAYRVGIPSGDWQQVKLEKAVIAFYSPSLNSTIATDSFCEQAYNDSPLESLTKHLFPGLQDPQILRQQAITLARREALRTLVAAKMDGVPVKLDIVVVKKDWCLFDFYLVSPPNRHAEAVPAFEKFYLGFAYQGEAP